MDSSEVVALVSLILILASSSVSGIRAPATLYTQAGFEGGKKAIYGLDRIGSCRTLSDFNDQTVSVDLAPNYCVRMWGGLCDDRNHVIIDLSSDSSERLDISPYGFTGGEGVSAIQRIACPVDTDVPVLYTGASQTGRSQPVYGLDKPGDCVFLPQFNDLARSLYVPEGKCLHLFGGGCDDSNYANMVVSAHTNVNKDLASAGFVGGAGLSTVKLVKCKPEPVGTLYSETNQNGAPKALDQLQKIGDCQTLPDFNDRTKSASVKPGSCLRLFGGGCNDFNHVVLDVDSTSPELDNLAPSGFVGGEGISAVALIDCPDSGPAPPAPAPPGPEEPLGDLSGFVIPPPPKTGIRLFPKKNYASSEFKYTENLLDGFCVNVGTSYSSLQVATDVCATLQEHDCSTSVSDTGRTAAGPTWYTDFDKTGFRTPSSSLKFTPCSGASGGSPSFVPTYFGK